METARTIYSNFKIVINHAVKFFGLKQDPSLPVPAMPRGDKRLNFIKLEEFDIQVQQMDLHYYKELTILMFYTGLRVGEAFALKWEDIYFENKQIDVNKAWDLAKRTVTTLKNRPSRAIVPIPAVIVGMHINIKKIRR